MTGSAAHWNAAYATKGETAVSWFQDQPARSIELIESYAPNKNTPVIDVGGGASRLADTLMARDYSDLTVLDISSSALDAAKARLGCNAGKVDWIAADVTSWTPSRSWGLWHDRAVFHFLISKANQDAYLRALQLATSIGSTVIIATFALDGPERCSGLPVQRYSPETLHARLGRDFTLSEAVPEAHVTPGGVRQSFVYTVLTRIRSGS